MIPMLNHRTFSLNIMYNLLLKLKDLHARMNQEHNIHVGFHLLGFWIKSVMQTKSTTCSNYTPCLYATLCLDGSVPCEPQYGGN